MFVILRVAGLAFGIALIPGWDFSLDRLWLGEIFYFGTIPLGIPFPEGDNIDESPLLSFRGFGLCFEDLAIALMILSFLGK